MSEEETVSEESDSQSDEEESKEEEVKKTETEEEGGEIKDSKKQDEEENKTKDVEDSIEESDKQPPNAEEINDADGVEATEKEIDMTVEKLKIEDESKVEESNKELTAANEHNSHENVPLQKLKVESTKEKHETHEPEMVLEKVVRPQLTEQNIDSNKVLFTENETNIFEIGEKPQSDVPYTVTSRVVSNAVPSMNSQSHDRITNLANEMNQVSFYDDSENTSETDQYYRRPNVPQSSIYHRNPTIKKIAAPSWYTPPEKPITNIFTAPPSYQYSDSPTAVKSRVDQDNEVASPTRKLSASTPYVGSHVIAAETGPSLTVLLRRPNSERQWGFSLYGGAEYGCPPFVNKITKNGLAFQNGVQVGDVIVSICNALTVGKTHEQLKAELLRAGNDLDLVLIRRGVDIEKVSKIIPQLINTTPQSPPPSIISSTPVAEGYRPRSGQSLTRGRSFRSVKTKSIRILEEQLATSQLPGSVITTKQHFQGARGLPASGAASSFTTAYGQGSGYGYAGRSPNIQPVYSNTVNAAYSPNTYSQPYSQQYVQPSHQVYQPSRFVNRGAVQWDQPPVPSESDWETRSEVTMNWNNQTYMQPRMAHQPMPVSYNAVNYPSASNQHTVSSSITVPFYGKPNYSNQPM